MMSKNKILILTLIMGLNISPLCYADQINIDLSNTNKSLIKNITVSKSKQNNLVMNVNLSKNNSNDYIRNGLYDLSLGDIKNAYSDFKTGYAYAKEDYDKFNFAKIMASVGIFSLSQQALNDISDKNLWSKQTQSLKRIYFPSNILKETDEITVVEALSELNLSNNDYNAHRLLKENSSIKSNDFSTYVVAKAFGTRKNNRAIVSYLVSSIKKNPSNLNYKLELAKAYSAQKQYGLGLSQINTILNSKFYDDGFRKEVKKEQFWLKSKDKNDFTSKYYLAKYYALTGEYDNALKILNNLKKNHPKNSQIYALRGDVNYSIDSMIEAKNDYEKALSFNSKNSNSLKGIGNIYFSQKKYKNSLVCYLKALKYSENSADIMVSVANNYNKLNQQDIAMDYYQKALSIDDLNSTANYQLGLMYKDGGDYKTAITYFKKALSVDNGNKEIIKELAGIEK